MNKNKTPAILFFILLWLPASVAAGLFVGALVLTNLLPIKATPTPFLLLHYWSRAKIPDNMQQPLMMSTTVAVFLALAAILLFLIILFMKSKRELHGSSRFASASEITQVGLLKKPEVYKTGYPDLLLGKYKGKYLRWASNEFMFLAARTRSGKGVSTVIPNCLHYWHSMVIYDPKLENFLISAGWRERVLKQKIFLLNPAGRMPEHERNPNAPLVSHKWNPMTYIRRNPLYTFKDLSNMAKILIPKSPKDTGTSSFFTDNARNLFVGLGLYLIETEKERDLSDYKQRTTLSNLRHLCTPSNGKTLFEWIKDELDSRNAAGSPLSEQAQTLLRGFANSNAKSGNDVLSTLTAPLAIFLDPVVEAVTSDDDFRLDEIRSSLMTIYVGVIPSEAETFSRLINLFFSQLVNVNVEQGLPENSMVNGKTKFPYQCLLLMDEFTALGAIPAISDGVSYIAGYGLRLLIIIQAPSQVEAVYGRDNMKTFFTNFTTRVFFTPREQWEAEEYSKIIGDETFKAKSRSRTTGKGGTSTSTSDQRRAVMNPSEIKLMPMTDCVIDMAAARPIYAEKIVYYKDPVFEARAFQTPPEVPPLNIQMHRKNAIAGSIVKLEDVPPEHLASTPMAKTANALDVAFSMIKRLIRANDSESRIAILAANTADEWGVPLQPLQTKMLEYASELAKRG